MDYNILLAVAGILLSLVFSYVPGAATWFNKKDTTKQRLWMLLFLVVAACGAYGLSCAKIIGGVACDWPGAIEIGKAFVFAAIANQTTNLLSPKVGLKRPPDYDDLVPF